MVSEKPGFRVIIARTPPPSGLLFFRVIIARNPHPLALHFFSLALEKIISS